MRVKPWVVGPTVFLLLGILLLNPTESAKLLSAYFKANGLPLADDEVAQEFRRRPLYTTKEQLALFDKKSNNPGEVEKWMADIADFFVQQGRITAAEKDKFMTGNFINDKILKMIAQ